MTKRKYAEAIVELIGGTVQEVKKTNGIVKTGIVRTTQNSNIAPTVYVDEFYEDDVDIEAAAAKIDEILKANEQPSIDVNMITDWETVKPHIKARLFNKKTKVEVYRKADKYGLDGLIIAPYVDLSFSMPGATVKITKGLLSAWGKTSKTVIDLALEQSTAEMEIVPMTVVMKEIIRKDMASKGTVMDEEEFEEFFEMMFGSDDIPMKVISNKNRWFGAIGCITYREKLQEMFPEGYVIFPSSIHEVIVTPYREEMTEDELNDMVGQVNMTEGDPSEVLGSKAYIFKGVAA